MILMSEKFSRRLFVSLASSIGALYASGALAGNDGSEVIIGTRFPDTFVPAGGPRVTQPLLKSTHYGSGLDAIRNAGSHPPLTEDRRRGLDPSVEKIRIQPGIDPSR